MVTVTVTGVATAAAAAGTVRPIANGLYGRCSKSGGANEPGGCNQYAVDAIVSPSGRSVSVNGSFARLRPRSCESPTLPLNEESGRIHGNHFTVRIPSLDETVTGVFVSPKRLRMKLTAKGYQCSASSTVTVDYKGKAPVPEA